MNNYLIKDISASVCYLGTLQCVGTKVVCHREEFRNFVFGEHRENCLINLCIGHHKVTIR